MKPVAPVTRLLDTLGDDRDGRSRKPQQADSREDTLGARRKHARPNRLVERDRQHELPVDASDPEAARFQSRANDPIAEHPVGLDAPPGERQPFAAGGLKRGSARVLLVGLGREREFRDKQFREACRSAARALSDAGWVSSRAEGPSNVYTMARELDASARRLWTIVREQVGGTHAAVDEPENFTPVLRTQALEIFRRYDSGSLYTLPSMRGTTAISGFSKFKEEFDKKCGVTD